MHEGDAPGQNISFKGESRNGWPKAVILLVITGNLSVFVLKNVETNEENKR